MPFAYSRTVAGAEERADVDRVGVPLHRVEPRAEAVRAGEGAHAAARRRVSSPAWPSVREHLSFDGAGVSPSPRIIVVTPCVIMLDDAAVAERSCSYDWAWMSMKPGATTRPRASMRCVALARARARRAA